MRNWFATGSIVLKTINTGLFLFLLLASPTVLLAQVDTGAIIGQVSDASGGRVPGAQITVKEESTGITNSLKTGNDGGFTFSPLKLGTYTLTVEKVGFKSTAQGNIHVTIQSRLEVNPVLEVGSVSETVQVTSGAPILETQNSSVQQLVEQRAINDLPLNGRNAAFLAQLSPGVTFSQNDGRNLQASGSFTANGARRTQNNYLLDGMDNNVNIAGLDNQSQFVLLPPPDALREFTVQTSNYSAEFGHSAGAVLNVSTKSGGNKLHGDIWEYLRNDVFDAKDYFVLAGQRIPEYRLNQFGGTLGGPVVIPFLYNGHDRTFFFMDYQGSRIVQGHTYTKNVPTLAERNSNFSNLQDLITLQTGTRKDALNRVFPTGTVFDPVTTRAVTAGVVDPVTGLPAASTGYVRDPFYTGSLTGKTDYTTAIAQLNQIPVARINADAVRLMMLYTVPTAPGLLSNLTVSPPNVTNVNSMDVRLDHQFGQHDSAFLRYGLNYRTQDVPSPFPGVADGGDARPGSGQTKAHNAALSYTHIFTPHLVNEARFGYSRVWDYRLQANANTTGIPAQYGIPGVPTIAQNGGLPVFDFGQLSTLGAPGFLPSDKSGVVVQGTDNFTIDSGSHQIRLGVEIQHINFPARGPTYPRGDFTHSGIFTSVVNNTDTSTDRAQFVLTPLTSPYGKQFDYLGGANALTATSFPNGYPIYRNYDGGYVQDFWRVASNFTVNFGMRYEYIGAPNVRDGRFASFVSQYTGDSPDGLNHYYIPRKHVAELPAAFIALLGSNNILLNPIDDNAIGIAQKTNFAPRVGFALQPVPKMSVRGGYGMFYQPNESHGLSTSPYINFPFQVTSAYTSGSAVQGIIADKINHTTPEGTVGPISQGLLNVPLDPAIASVSSLAFQGEPRYPKTTYSQSYSLQVQYQVEAHTVFFVGYIGSNTRHAQSSIGSNTTNTINATNVTLQSKAFFSTISTGGNYVGHNAFSNYNSLQVGAERRFSGGFAFIANLTWSKCLGTIRDLLDNGVGGYRAPYVAGMGIGADNTLCDIDVRRLVHTSGTYELPFGKNHRFLQSGLGEWIAGGWSTNWIFTAQDGQPFSITCPTTTAVGLGCFALKVPGQDPYAGPHNATQFLNPAAFANPPVVPAGTTGTAANLGGPGGQVTGPPFRRFDMSIFRRFTFVHETYFEFRAEVFNVTNTPNLAQPSTLNFATPATFGRISATRDNPNDPREMQLSLKYYF